MEWLQLVLGYERNFLLRDWQWGFLFCLFATAYLVEKIIYLIAHVLINKNIPIIRNAPKDLLKKTLYPASKLLFVFIINQFITFLNVSQKTEKIINQAMYIITALVLTWFLHRLVDIVSYYFNDMAQKTASKFDDILVPLLQKIAYIIVYSFGGMFFAHAIGIDIRGILAGLGIGGLAFAFAAKDTIANFFGSIMLIIDRPFDIGDIIVAQDIEGTVVEVGFRSTRIRTPNDSIITIANGNLTNLSIENKGRRRYRRFKTLIGVEYSTPVKKIEAFCEGIRQLILEHKWTHKEEFYVNMANFSSSSLDIEVIVFWKTSDYAREALERHRLLIDIIRLSEKLEINFAFPTQTIFVAQEAQKENFDVDYLKLAESNAKILADSPISFKNPRSNIKAREQFELNSIDN